MLNRLRQRMSDERGFTLIELLVVILIIGILAAIAIPSFLNQKNKASDASAKELVRTAQTVAETYATDNNGSYSGLSTTEENKYEKTIPIAAAANKSTAWLNEAKAIESSEGYEVEATAEPTGDKYKITRNKNGEITRTCTPVSKGSCPASGDW